MLGNFTEISDSAASVGKVHVEMMIGDRIIVDQDILGLGAWDDITFQPCHWFSVSEKSTFKSDVPIGGLIFQQTDQLCWKFTFKNPFIIVLDDNLALAAGASMMSPDLCRNFWSLKELGCLHLYTMVTLKKGVRVLLLEQSGSMYVGC